MKKTSFILAVTGTTTRSGGTPYGASHVAGNDSNLPISDDEAILCRALGRRVAEIAKQLA